MEYKKVLKRISNGFITVDNSEVVIVEDDKIKAHMTFNDEIIQCKHVDVVISEDLIRQWYNELESDDRKNWIERTDFI